MPKQKSNTRRPIFPPMFKHETTEFTDAYSKFVSDMGVCYSLVDIAKSVLNRPDLSLVAGGQHSRPPILKAATDGTKIWLPKMHPNRRIATKHELAHIYFDSNVPLRLAFVRALLADIAKRSNTEFQPYVKNQLVEDLCFLINIFDDIRVNSLWGMLYPGDGVAMDNWYFGIIGPAMLKRAEEEYTDGDIDHLFTYAMLLVLGQEPKSTLWCRFRDDIIIAKEQVHGRSFKGLLLIVRVLLERLATAIAEDAPPPSEAPAWGGPDPTEKNLTKAMSRLETRARRPSAAFSHDDAGFNHQDPSPVGDSPTVDDVEEILGTGLDEDSVWDILDAEEVAQLQKVMELQKQMDSLAEKEGGGGDEALVRNIKADVQFIDVRKSDVLQRDLPAADVRTAEMWAGHFRKVMGAMKRRVGPVGYEIVMPLYIQQKLNNQPLVCYRRPQTGRGFRLVVLIDLSLSMQGYKFDQVERLFQVLQKSLDFPSVHMTALGFYSAEKGVVNIVRYERGVTGLFSAKSQPAGVTPLSHAIQVAGQTLAGCKHDSYLFVLSDGKPVFRLKRDSPTAFVGENVLINWTADAVREMHAKRVRTYCFMVGRHHGVDIPSAAEMDKMFGQGFWRKLTEENLFRDSFAFVRTQFLKYLRTR